MAKTTLETYFQDFNFHVIDLTAPANILGGGGQSPFLALSPQVGFKSADIPDTSIETEEVEIGNDPFPHHHPTGASVGSATLERGVLVGDMEFYEWVRRTAYGRGKIRRTLGVIQVHGMPKQVGAGGASVGGQAIAPMVQRLTAIIAQGAGALAMAQQGVDTQNAAGGRGAAAGAAAQGAATVGGIAGGGGAARAGAAALQDISARAWVLEDCIPVNYSPATSGLDADSEDVTMASIELQPDKVREANFPPNAGI